MQNGLGRLHGLAVASVAERVAIACAKTVLGEEKDLFLGELSNTYLSSAPRNVSVFCFDSLLLCFEEIEQCALVLVCL